MQINDDWTLLCSRLDITLMAVYQTANIVIALWFVLPFWGGHTMHTLQKSSCE
jgi:hypothetical protein